MPHDVVVVGSINVDLLLTVPRHPAPGETLMGGAGTLSPGGKGANQAVAAARLGARTAMVGAVGDDANASLALRELRAAGVDVSAVDAVPGPTGLAVVTLAEDGENAIVVVPGANAQVTPERVADVAELLAAARVCVLQGEIPAASVDRAAAMAASAGARVVLNVAPARPTDIATLRRADPLVVNQHEAALLLAWSADRPAGGPGSTAQHAPAADAEPSRSAALDSARRLVQLGVRSVVVTLGGAGAVGVGPEGEWVVPAREVAVRDTTGAGDAFVGALAAALAGDAHLAEAAERATTVAAWSVQRLGAQTSYPWSEDLP